MKELRGSDVKEFLGSEPKKDFASNERVFLKPWKNFDENLPKVFIKFN
jgi:hypothetical protein